MSCMLTGDVALTLGSAATLPKSTVISSTPSLVGGVGNLFNFSSLSSIFIVPPNGVVELRGVRIAGAIDVGRYPLSASEFLDLRAFQIGNGSKLRLVNSIISAPSCVALALRQAYACGVSPSPNFTVAPNSLLVHSFSTPSLDATNVTLLCGGPPLPFPCQAAVVSSGRQLLNAIVSAQKATVNISSETRPWLYVYLNTTITLSDDAWRDIDRSLCVSPLNSSLACTIALTIRVAIAGAPGGSTILDVANITSVLQVVMKQGSVMLRNLTLRNLPPGPEGTAPWSLLRLPVWVFSFRRRILGAVGWPLLTVVNVTLELPPEEVALWAASRAPLPPLPLPPNLVTYQCAVQADGLFGSTNLTAVTGTNDLLMESAIGYSKLITLTGVVLRPVGLPVGSGGTSKAGGGYGNWSGSTILPTQPATSPSPSVCLLTVPGASAPAKFLQDAKPISSLIPSASLSIGASAYGSYTTLFVEEDAYVNPEDTAETQAHVVVPGMLMGEPLRPRVLDWMGVAAALLVSGPQAALTLRLLTLINAPAAGLHPTAPLSALATQGMPPSLANFTSCLWPFQFDRLQPSSSLGAGIPLLYLDSVVVLVPQQELELLARVWSWAKAITSGSKILVSDPGLSVQLRSMLTGSKLAATPSTASPSALTFERLKWCGVVGCNVTITYVLQAVTDRVVRPLSLGLPFVGLRSPTPSPRPSPRPKNG